MSGPRAIDDKYAVNRAAVHLQDRTDAQTPTRSTPMSPQSYYNKIVILGRRGGPTFADAQRDLVRLNEAIRAQVAA